MPDRVGLVERMLGNSADAAAREIEVFKVAQVQWLSAFEETLNNTFGRHGRELVESREMARQRRGETEEFIKAASAQQKPLADRVAALERSIAEPPLSPRSCGMASSGEIQNLRELHTQLLTAPGERKRLLDAQRARRRPRQLLREAGPHRGGHRCSVLSSVDDHTTRSANSHDSRRAYKVLRREHC